MVFGCFNETIKMAVDGSLVIKVDTDANRARLLLNPN